MSVGSCHRARLLFGFGCAFVMIFGCLWAPPWGARQEKSDLFEDLSGLGVRLHFLRVFRDSFSINLLKVCTVLLRIPMSFG